MRNWKPTQTVVILFMLLGALTLWEKFLAKIEPIRLSPMMLGSNAFRDIEDLQERLHGLRKDAGATNTLDLYNRDALENAISEYIQRAGVERFEAMLEVYNRSLRALVLFGGSASARLADSPDAADRRLSGIFAPGLMEKISRHVGSDIPLDPWGNPYQLFLGPWPDKLGPIVFRCYSRAYRPKTFLNSNLIPVNSAASDCLTVTLAKEEHGIPAPKSMDIYIWSYGLNGVSDQALFDPSLHYNPPFRQYYRKDAPDRYLGGGDDINNWDASGSSNEFYTGKTP